MNRTVTALVIEPSMGESGQRCRLVQLPTDGDALPTLQKIVGGYIESFSFGKPGESNWDCHLWINEEGKYTLGENYYNGLATDLVRHLLLPRDWICGTVIVAADDGHGNDADVPDWVVDKIRSWPDCRWVDD